MPGSTTQSRSNYQQLSRRVVDWARTQPFIQAILLVGSRARVDHSADQWSDLDLVLFVSDLEPYQRDWTWLSAFGEVLLHVQDFTGRGDPEWLVLFADGLKGDFALVNVPELLADSSSSIEALLAATDYYREVYQRGVVCLLDKNNPHNDNLIISWRAPQPSNPSQEDFEHTIHLFLIDAHRAAKFIQRRDLWRARQVCNENVTRHLLTLLEWHARAVREVDADTWYDGRFIEKWADPRFIQELPKLFGGYDHDQLSRALESSIHCFEWLSHETAAAVHLDYPADAVALSLRLILEITGFTE
jgi:aminoglycoside 6-adenylyltransferase